MTIPDSVTRIAQVAFGGCTSLISVTIPNSVTSIGREAFRECTSLESVYFQANPPSISSDVFWGTHTTTVYYLPGTAGWWPTYSGRPTALRLVPQPIILTTAPDFGIHDNALGFRISWATNASVIVEASTTLSGPTWSPVGTITLTEGWYQFRDPEWAHHPTRFYRVRPP